jgi:thioredoxin-like negative regulator of GroEL
MAVNDDNFDEMVLRASKPVIVMFWQAGCGFCKALLNVLIKVGGGMQFVNFAVLDADACPKLLQRYDVHAFPALLAFRDGQCIDRRFGAASIGSITTWVKEKMT